MELVQIQPALAGGASVTALLARVESHGTAHAQDGDSQSILRWRGRPGRHIDARLRRDAVTPAIDQFLPGSFSLILMSLYLRASIYRELS